jgi:hypothetical protein
VIAENAAINVCGLSNATGPDNEPSEAEKTADGIFYTVYGVLWGLTNLYWYRALFLAALLWVCF